MTQSSEAIPQAVVRRSRGLGWWWLVPVLALAFSGFLVQRAWQKQGIAIELSFAQGHGLAPGDELRFRGIGIGVVDSVDLARSRRRIDVHATLRPGNEDLAVTGTRFWIVRPQFDLTGVGGLETVIGPRYVAVLPGDGSRQRRFVGLERAPIVAERAPGDLEIVVEAPSRTGLRPGTPVLYRQVNVGKVLSVGLTSDGGSVESRLHIRQAYVHLVRPETMFWSAGGLETKLTVVGGVSLSFDSIETLLAGGVALSTPPNAGEVVRNGHRFTLAEKPESDWLDWTPMVAIGNAQLPPGAPLPRPMHAKLSWKEDRYLILNTEHSATGWVLLTDRGLLGPAGLLHPSGEFQADSVVLEVAGKAFNLPERKLLEMGDLAFLDLPVEGVRRWSNRRIRIARQPEDCLAVGDPAIDPLPLSAGRLAPTEDGAAWEVDPELVVEKSWHGAVVLSRTDGKLLGSLLAEGGAARVALLADDAPPSDLGGESGSD